MATLPTLVSIGHFSPIPIQLDLEALAVVSALDFIRGHLDKAARRMCGFIAAEVGEILSKPRERVKNNCLPALTNGLELASTGIEQYHKCLDDFRTLFRQLTWRCSNLQKCAGNFRGHIPGTPRTFLAFAREKQHSVTAC